MAGTEELTGREIAQKLNKEAGRLCKLLYPMGVEVGGFFCIGNVHGASGNSLKVRVAGDKIGTWADYACDENDPMGKGDMLKLVQFTVAEQPTIGSAIQWAKAWMGIESMSGDALAKWRRESEAAQRRADQKRAGERAQKQRQAEGMWLGAAKALGTPALQYLHGRGIDFARIGSIPGALRFRPDVYHVEKRAKLPAMCTAYWSITGEIAACHVTWIERLPDGRWDKLRGVEDTKKTFSPTYWGAHIPLNKGLHKVPLKDIPEGTPVFVSEGIEDGLTYAMARPDARIVAAGTLGNIGALILPPQAGDLIIIGQHDRPGSKADKSLEAQIAKQQRQAREQGSARLIRCVWPDPAFKDFNDQLRGIPMKRED